MLMICTYISSKFVDLKLYYTNLFALTMLSGYLYFFIVILSELSIFDKKALNFLVLNYP